MRAKVTDIRTSMFDGNFGTYLLPQGQGETIEASVRRVLFEDNLDVNKYHTED